MEIILLKLGNLGGDLNARQEINFVFSLLLLYLWHTRGPRMHVKQHMDKSFLSARKESFYIHMHDKNNEKYK